MGIIENEKGATSVFVIFMMLVLVTFGTFSIVAVKADIKFGKKAMDWNRRYYEIDSMGEEFICKVDMALHDAEEEVAGGDYSDGDYFEAAYSSLVDLRETYRGLSVMSVMEDGVYTDLIGEIELKGETDENFNLIIRFNIIPLNITADGDDIDIGRKRFEVTEWRQQQVTRKYNGDVELWPGLS